MYASPVDRETRIIGDFGMTFYLGKDPAIINHLKKCLDINREIFASIKAGMNLSEVQRLGMKIISKNRVSNDVVSVTEPDSTGIIGHTIPASYEEWTKEEMKILQESWTTAKDLISSKRKFLSGAETLGLKNGMAITIEPRLIDAKDKKIPMASYHSIAVFHADGTKDLLENFNGIFALTNMDYML
ncbi:MAG: Peptidase M24, structural protein [archaeon GW2011_AR5]|nr:MAG: Peptidase M24, structural protein [archaeon GW2011_AR5]